MEVRFKKKSDIFNIAVTGVPRPFRTADPCPRVFYARKDWESYSKPKLWMICIIDMLIAGLYHLDILLEPTDEYTAYMLTEIWIRPTITYGLVACFIQEKNNQS